MTAPRAAFAARVTGRVQGVGFRATTQQWAGELGVTGWVRNEPDGSVSALFAGTPAALAEMRGALREGPPAARVAAVEETPAAPGDAPKRFEILP